MKGNPIGASVTQSLDRAVDMLRLVGSAGTAGITLAGLARAANLAKPTVHRLLGALERQGFVERGQRGDSYHLGRDIFVLGMLASERHGIARIATPFLQRLAEETGDAVLLTLRQGRHGICILREEGAFPLRSHALKVGDRHPLGVGSNSLAILAALDDAEIAKIMPLTSHDVAVHYPAFADLDWPSEIARTRTEGYALNPGRLLSGSWGMAVPVHDAGGQCIASLSIAAIERRMQEGRRPELAKAMISEAVALSRALGRGGC